MLISENGRDHAHRPSIHWLSSLTICPDPPCRTPRATQHTGPRTTHVLLHKNAQTIDYPSVLWNDTPVHNCATSHTTSRHRAPPRICALSPLAMQRPPNEPAASTQQNKQLHLQSTGNTPSTTAARTQLQSSHITQPHSFLLDCATLQTRQQELTLSTVTQHH